MTLAGHRFDLRSWSPVIDQVLRTLLAALRGRLVDQQDKVELGC
jgi:hypothetical protein